MRKKISPVFKVALFCLLTTYSCVAYTQSIDSLEKVLQKQKEDTNRVNTLLILSDSMRVANDKKNALEKANEALSISEKINYQKGKGRAYLNIGKIFQSQNNYLEAQKFFSIALKINRETGDEFNIALSYDWIAYTYDWMGDYPDALINFIEALKLYEKLGDKRRIVHTLQLISGAYAFQGNYSEALKNNLSALKITEEIGDKGGVAQAHLNNGEIYSDLGNYVKALSEYNMAIKLFEQLKENLSPYINSRIGKVYEKQGDIALASGDQITSKSKFSEALKNYTPFFSMTKESTDKEGQVLSCTDMGTINIKLGNFTAAKNYIQKSIHLAKEIGSKRNLVNSYRGLAQLDSSVKNYQQAYEDYKLYILYRDSLNNDETAKKTLQAKMQFEFDKKQAIANAEQDRKNAEVKRIKDLQYFAIASLIILLLVILLIAFIQWRNNKHKQRANVLLHHQKEKVEVTLQELKSTQAQLIQSAKMASLGELTAGIAHEIQNPLNFVNNFSEVNKELIDEMQQEMDKGNYIDAKEISNDIKENEEKINHHGKRADAIVKGMLQHSRTTNSTKEPTDINKLADEYLRLAYHGLRAKDKSFNATLKTDFDESIGNINIIPQDIGRVVLNLINNAFYAVNEKKNASALRQAQDSARQPYEPTVTVSTSRSLSFGEGRGEVKIKISDNGNGIPSKVLDKIFQPFFTTKPTGQGTGLGLSLAYDIVKAHGGELKVETKEGEGSTFLIILNNNI